MPKICEKGRKNFSVFLAKLGKANTNKGLPDMEINVSKNLFGNRIDKEICLRYNSIYSAIRKKRNPIYCGFGRIQTQGPQSLDALGIGGFGHENLRTYEADPSGFSG